MIVIFSVNVGLKAVKVGENEIDEVLLTDFSSYTVRPGDSLYKIGQSYGLSIKRLKEINDLDSSVIYIGQQLLVPGTNSGFNYVVQAGDSLFLLARKFNVSLEQLKSENNLQTDIIYIGQQLVIPGTKKDENKDEDSNEKEKEETKEVFKVPVQGELVVNNETGNEVDFIYQSQEEFPVFQVSEQKQNEERKELIVKYKPLVDSQSRNDIEQQNDLQTLGEMKNGENMIVRYDISENDDPDSLIEYYEGLRTVEWVEPNYRFYPQAIPSDLHYKEKQWNLIYSNLEAAWDMQTGSDSVTVAVVDTGIIPDHPDLKDNLLSGADFVGGERSYPVESYTKTDNDPTDETTREQGGSHGTHVAGILGAVGNNNRGIAGINWQLKILPVRALKKSGGSSWDIAEGIYYALDQGADIINLSLGSNNRSNLQHEAIKKAYQKGVTVVAAAGNEGQNRVYYPAAFPETIAVGAVNSQDSLTHYSNYGPEIDVVAPGGGAGESIFSTWGYLENGQPVSNYAGMVGTSMAAPHVSGIAALLVASGLEEPDMIRDRLVNTGQDLPTNDYQLVDAYGALQGNKLDKPRVFAVTKGGDVLKKASEAVKVEDDEFYLDEFTNREVYFVGWRDVNQNGQVDQGDYFTMTESYSLKEDQKYNLDLELKYVSEIDVNYIIE